MAGPDYILDIDARRLIGADADNAENAFDAGTGESNACRAAAPMHGRPWIAVKWRCCGAYSRIYRNRAGDAYEGRCPRCQAAVRARIGPDGTAHRFFEAG